MPNSGKFYIDIFLILFFLHLLGEKTNFIYDHEYTIEKLMHFFICFLAYVENVWGVSVQNEFLGINENTRDSVSSFHRTIELSLLKSVYLY